MKITRISIYRKNLSYASGAFAWGRGNVIESSSSTVVVIDTDTGMSGVGEFCPCGENYMVAHSEGTEAAARSLAPRRLGEDPRQLSCIERLMDHRIKVVSEDTWGGEIATAAVAHFAASTPAELLLNITDLHSYNKERTGFPAPRTADGNLYTSDAPGLGVEADLDSLGAPVAVYGRQA